MLIKEGIGIKLLIPILITLILKLNKTHMLTKLLNKIFPDLDKKIESEYRLVKENRYDEVEMEMNTFYFIQKKNSITNWNTITREFPTEKEALLYYSKIKEYLNNKKLIITYLN